MAFDLRRLSIVEVAAIGPDGAATLDGWFDEARGTPLDHDRKI